MKETRFVPPSSWGPRIAPTRIAPTEEDENHHLLRGVVHDPTARRMGGVAGHAGLFSTADDLAIFAQALLDGGRGVLTPATIAKMTAPQQPVNGTAVRGFGWDIDSPFSTNRGELLPVGGYGHTGFTGTSLWIDPATKTYIVLLTNAVHMNVAAARRRKREARSRCEPRSRPRWLRRWRSIPPMRRRCAWQPITGYNEMQSAARKLAVRNGTVKTGIDVLEETKFAALHPAKGGAPRSIGLLTNQTGMDSEGRRTIDVLANVPGISLDAIFSPEHGVTGTLDTTDIKECEGCGDRSCGLQRVWGERRGAASAAGRAEAAGCGRDRSGGCGRALLHLRDYDGIFSGSGRARRELKWSFWIGRIRLRDRLCRGRFPMPISILIANTRGKVLRIIFPSRCVTE